MPEMNFFPDTIYKNIDNKKEVKNDLVMNKSKGKEQDLQNSFSHLNKNEVFISPQDDI